MKISLNKEERIYPFNLINACISFYMYKHFDKNKLQLLD